MRWCMLPGVLRDHFYITYLTDSTQKCEGGVLTGPADAAALLDYVTCSLGTWPQVSMGL